MDQELERIASLIRDARDPEDLFGVDPVLLPRGVQVEKRKSAYEALKAITSLEYQLPDDSDVARDLDRRLEDFYGQARNRIEIGAYNLQGRGGPVPRLYRGKFFDAGVRRYYIGSQFRQGDETTLYNGYLEIAGVALGEVILKVANSPDTTAFVERESNVLGVLRKKDYRETSYLPTPLDRFDAGGRMGLVLRRVDGFNLDEVRSYPPHRDGLDARDMVWMLTRTLTVMGMAHQYGVVHGRICPKHIMVEPETHRGLVVGWGGAAIAPARTGQQVVSPIETFSAPEAATSTAGPWSDIYSIGKTYIWLLGGDPATDDLPEPTEPRVAAFLRGMTIDDPYQRPEDCWQLFETLERLKKELWGERRWRHLDMPPPAAVA